MVGRTRGTAVARMAAGIPVATPHVCNAIGFSAKHVERDCHVSTVAFQALIAVPRHETALRVNNLSLHERHVVAAHEESRLANTIFKGGAKAHRGACGLDSLVAHNGAVLIVTDRTDLTHGVRDVRPLYVRITRLVHSSHGGAVHEELYNGGVTVGPDADSRSRGPIPVARNQVNDAVSSLIVPKPCFVPEEAIFLRTWEPTRDQRWAQRCM